MEKKLYRSKTDKKLCGVCGGFAKYFNLDPTLVRVIWIIVALCAFGLLAYLICALAIPEEPAEAQAPVAEVKPAEEKKEESENKSEENVENK